MTIFIIIITCIISISAFSRPEIMNKLQLNPHQVAHRKEWHRLFTHGFVHADWLHLFVNMFVLYSFGRHVEVYFGYLFSFPKFNFILFYSIAIIIASLTTVKKYKENPWYNSVGASGAVSAVVFCAIFFAPGSTLLVYFIPMPAIVFGALYLIYSQYMSKKGKDNVNHDAHFIGAVFGFLFPLAVNIKLFNVFLNQLANFF